MLVLSRRMEETIVIGEVIHITVLSIRGNQVRIGIEAPPSISVHREEIFLKIKEEQDAASVLEVS